MKTQQEINTLKADWARDRSWDLEDTPGFEEHAEELRSYVLDEARCLRLAGPCHGGEWAEMDNEVASVLPAVG